MASDRPPRVMFFCPTLGEGGADRVVLTLLQRLDRGRARRALEVPVKRVTYRRADLVTAVSSGVARELASLLALAASNIRVVYNPVVDEELAAAAAEPVDHPWFQPRAATPVIVAVGRLVEIKDYPTLLDAFARIRAARAVRLFVLGDGPLRGALEARV